MLRTDDLELVWAGDYSWRVTDTRVPPDSPAHIVASIVARDEDFEVLWVRGATAPAGTFRTFPAALDAISGVIAGRT